MACTIQYTNKKITGVLDKDRNDSILFREIVGNPHMDVNSAVEAYKNVYSSKFQGDEESLAYKNNKGEVFSSFAEALKATNSGNIEAFAGELTLFSVDSSKDSNEYGGFLNNMIVSDLLLDKTILDTDGNKVFQVAGASNTMREVKAQQLADESFATLGARNVTVLSDNNFLFEDRKYKAEVLNKNGEKEFKSQKEIDELSLETLRKNYENPEILFLDKELSNAPRLRTYGESKVIQDIVEVPDEDALKTQLMSLLNKLGVTVTSLMDYTQKYTIKNNVNLSAQALADLANKVVAFQGGQISTADLTEETAHFIVEGWNNSEIENILRNIHKSEEWVEFSDQYREVYGENYSGDELEQVVRKEILGKVLANSLKENFATQNKTETQNNFIQAVRGMFNSFMQKVQSLFKANYLVDLNKFNNQVFELLQAEELQNHLSNEQITGSKLTLYSLSNDLTDDTTVLRVKAKTVVRMLELVDRQRSKLGSTVSSRGNLQRITAQLNAVDEVLVRKADAENDLPTSKETSAQIKRDLVAIEHNSKVESFAGIVGSVKMNLKYLNQALLDNSKEKHPFSQEEDIVYSVLVNQMRPILENMQGLLSNSNFEDKKIKRDIEDLLLNIGELNGKVSNTDSTKAIEYLVDQEAIKHNWDDTTKENYFKLLKATKKDTNWGHAYFGTLAHAQNPVLNLFGSVIKRVVMDTTLNHLNATKQFAIKLDDLKLQPKDLDVLKEGSFVLDEMNHQLIQDTVSEIELKHYNSFKNSAYFNANSEEILTPKEPLELKEYLRKKRDGSLPRLANADDLVYRQKVKEELDTYLEKPFNDDYYVEKAKNFKDNNISLSTQKWLNEVSADYSNVFSRAKDENGTIVLTQSLRIELENIAKERATAASPYNGSGSLKQGLDAKITETGEFELSLLPNASEGAVMAYELSILDKIFLKNLKEKEEKEGGVKTKKEIPAKFLDAIKNLEAQGKTKEALEYLKLNSYLGFKNDFWDSLGVNTSLAQNLIKDGSEEAFQILEEIKETQNKKKNIIKANRVLNQPSETDVERMTRTEKENLRDYEEYLQDLYKQGLALTKDLRGEKKEDATTENTSNQAFADAIIDRGIADEEKVDFIKQHVTAADEIKIKEAEGIAERLIKNPTMIIPKFLQSTFNRDYSNMNEADKSLAIREDLIKYAEGKLLPYYSRFAPKGYSELMDSLEKGLTKVSDVISDENSILTVTPNYSFFEAQTDTRINPNFKGNYEGGYYQFKKNSNGKSFVNPKFEQTFGTITDGKASKNPNLFQAREALLEYQRDTLRAMGELGKHNLYKIPQKSKDGLKKFNDFLIKENKGESLKEAFKDSFGYREEDIATGEVVEGDADLNVEALRIIPKYGIRDLVNQEDLSDEMMSSYVWMHEQGMLHSARKEHVGSALALKNVISKDTYADKISTSTAAYKMFMSNLDEHFWGIREEYDKEIPLYKGYNINTSKILRMFGTFVRFRNLGFAVISPLTSLVTAKVQLGTEAWVGEHTDRASLKLAQKEYRKLAPASMNEMLAMNSKAPLNILGEHFGVYEADRRFEHSSFNKYMRGLVKAPYATHSMANFPVIPEAMLATLYDYRIVDGSIQTFNEFKRANSNKTALEQKNYWKSQEKNAIYNFIDTSKGVFEYKKEEINELLQKPQEEFDNYLKLKNEAIFQKITSLNSVIDGQTGNEEKSLAHRNMFLQLFLTHRSFIPIATAKRFKSAHYNLTSGQLEEGSYVTFGRFIKGYLDQFSKKDIGNIPKDFKNYWATFTNDNTPEGRLAKVNMQRNMKDFVVVNLLAGLGLILSSIADDPDKKDIFSLQLANYLMLRLVNETASVGVGIPNTMYETVQSAFVGLNSIPEVLAVGDIGDDTLITGGKWYGFSKNSRYFLRNTGWGKAYADTVNLTRVKESYIRNNGNFMNFIPMYILDSQK